MKEERVPGNKEEKVNSETVMERKESREIRCARGGVEGDDLEYGD